MVTIKTARNLALELPEAEEKPHFQLRSFRIRDKIFATLWEADRKMMVKLSLTDQSLFCSLERNIIYPVPGGGVEREQLLLTGEK